MQLDWFKRQVFGAKSERFISSDDLQMAIELNIAKKEDLDRQVAEVSVSYTKKNNTTKPVVGHGRGSMPTHLPIKDKIVEPDGDTSGMVKIGEEVSWYYEMDKPSSLHIVRTIRPKYAYPQKDGVTIGKLPALPVEKGNAGPGLIAQIISDKYIYHLPLDRQRKKFNTEYQVSFSESWLSEMSETVCSGLNQYTMNM
jgi:transposase